MWRLFSCLGRDGGDPVSISSRVSEQNLLKLPDGRVLRRGRLGEREEAEAGGNGSSITKC